MSIYLFSRAISGLIGNRESWIVFCNDRNDYDYDHLRSVSPHQFVKRRMVIRCHWRRPETPLLAACTAATSRRVCHVCHRRSGCQNLQRFRCSTSSQRAVFHIPSDSLKPALLKFSPVFAPAPITFPELSMAWGSLILRLPKEHVAS